MADSTFGTIVKILCYYVCIKFICAWARFESDHEAAPAPLQELAQQGLPAECDTDVEAEQEAFSLLQRPYSLASRVSSYSADGEPDRVQAQESHATTFDRYPVIFGELKALLLKSVGVARQPLRILSFGCSDGSEVRTMRSYFPDAYVDGVDIDKGLIARNVVGNSDPLVHYYSDTAALVPESYDAVLAMNVLLKYSRQDWKPSDPPISYIDYVTLMGTIDGLVRKGGYLVVYNSQYLVSDSPYAFKYRNMATDCGVSLHHGFPTSDKLHNFASHSFIGDFDRLGACSSTNKLCVESGWITKYNSASEQIQFFEQGCQFAGTHFLKLAK